MIRKPILTGALTALVVLLAAGPATAHVTVQPDTATAGDYTVLDVRVPNESDTEGTVAVAVQMPPGFAAASYQPVPGWKVTVKKGKLATPVETDDGPITEGVTEIVWTGSGKAGRIGPGEFQDFPLSVLIPDKAGETLTFKATQTYEDGEVVRWIGAPDSDEPAPTVKLTAAAADDTATTAAEPADPAAAAAEPEQAEAASGEKAKEKEHGGDTDGLAVAALIVGALGVVLGAGGLAAGRRKAAA